ncbi:MAG: Tol-Pal system protein TolB [Paracoccus denitrificans]|nr:MAG: Tol-Pal system protein TolB [Paracoccus denitrificans]PZO85874.1 MAG: Tol-Pal system protein TolB [Paracoccus denitrificans]
MLPRSHPTDKSALRRFLLTSAAALMLAAPLVSLGPNLAVAQDGPLRIEITDGVAEPMPIAIAPFFDDGNAGAMVAQVQKVVIDDLTGTGLFREIPAGAQIARPDSFEAPVAYDDWRAINAEALVTGAVSVDGDRVTVKFRLFDVFSGQPLGDGMQFDATQSSWRRAAHKAADQVYSRLTGEEPYFDSRVAFVNETGPKDARRKRIGLMDYDGANQAMVTGDETLVLSPHFSRDGRRLLYTSYRSGFPRLVMVDVASLQQRELPTEGDTMVFGARFSPDGRWIVYSREEDGNTDIWLMDPGSGTGRPLVAGPAIETSPSFSPDGRQIVYESDESGTQQLYVMPADGSAEATRITFGDGRYSTPAWSPKGDLIAFTRQQGNQFYIGVMKPDGSDEKILTQSFLDEGPSWAPNGRVVMFTRETPGGNGVARLHSVDVTGRNMRPLDIKGAASDPDWGPLEP